MRKGEGLVRVLVVSDVHGNSRALERAIEAQPTASAVLFLGDGLRQAQDAADRHPNLPFYMVPGNCDIGAAGPFSREECFGGKRFFFTHGHHYDVKYGLYRLDLAARERKADMVLFGHTHQPLSDYADGLYMLNPGSLGYEGRYAYVDVTPGGIMPVLLRL